MEGVSLAAQAILDRERARIRDLVDVHEFSEQFLILLESRAVRSLLITAINDVVRSEWPLRAAAAWAMWGDK